MLHGGLDPWGKEVLPVTPDHVNGNSFSDLKWNEWSVNDSVVTPLSEGGGAPGSSKPFSIIQHNDPTIGFITHGDDWITTPRPDLTLDDFSRFECKFL